MTRIETKQLIDKIVIYRPYFKARLGNDYFNQLVIEWTEKLENYDFEDVLYKLEEFLKDQNNSNKEPTVYDLIRGLSTREHKTEYGQYNSTCPLCGRIMELNYLHIHTDRCRSVNYLKKLYRKYFNKELDNLKDLYNMPNAEFEKRYVMVLEKINEMSNEEPFIKQVIDTYYGKTIDQPFK